MKRPLLVIAVGYILGIVWGLYCSCSIALLYFLLYLICLFIKLFLKSKKQFKLFSIKRYIRYFKIILKDSVIVTIIASSFISNSIVIYQNKKYNNLYHEVKETEVIGIIASNPEEQKNKKTCKLKVEKVNNSDKFNNTYLILNISNSTNTDIEYGDRVHIYGEYIQPNTQRNYKGFDYKEYLKTEKSYGTINAISIKTTKKACLSYRLMISNNIFKRIKTTIENNMPKKYSTLTLAIMCGYTNELNEDVKQNFRDSNIAHILAVSGMHITYITMAINIALEKLLGKKTSRIISIILLIIYMHITSFSPSVIRATIMGIAFILSKIIYRKNDIWNSGALSILCILIYNPFLIANVGLLFSYGGAIGIVIFYKTIKSVFSKVKIKNSRYKYKLKKIDNIIDYIKEQINISISVQLMIAPIMIINFNTVGVAFIITNFIISIIIGPIILLAFVLISISIFLNWKNKILFYPLIALLELLTKVSEIGSKIPFNKIYVKTPSFIYLLIYYLFIISINSIIKIYISKNNTTFEYRIRNIISLIRYKLRLNKKKIITGIVVLFILVSIIQNIPQKLNIHFIDIGQGDSTLIITPLKKSILIDGGGSLNNTFDVGKNTLLPYLLDRGINSIDYVIISHFDQDHVGRNLYYNGRN